MAVGSGRPPRRQDEEIYEFSDGVIVSGLCNGHSHLEYPDLLLKPEKNFSGFLRAMRDHRHEAARQPREKIIQLNALEGARLGETTVVDHISTGPLDTFEYPKIDPYPKIGRFLPMLEVLGGFQNSDLSENEAANRVFSDRLCGLGPHSTYTAGPSLLAEVAKLQKKAGLWVSVHAAESRDEKELFEAGNGDLANLMAELIPEARYESGSSALDPLIKAGLLNHRTLLVHANYLSLEEIELVGRTGTRVVHCPASHNFFKHKRFSWKQLQKSGASILLGTDSKATGGGGGLVSHLSLGTETSDASPADLWEAATLGGAKALGLDGITGRLETGFSADLFVLQNPQARASTMAEDLLNNPIVLASFVQGTLFRDS